MTNVALQGETLALSEWEIGNLHLPPVTTVTFYPGAPSVAFLGQRVAAILEKNPWLGGRLVKKSTPDRVVALSYSEDTEPAQPVERHLSVFAWDETRTRLDRNTAANRVQQRSPSQSGWSCSASRS